ncbi:MAG: histidine kinase [Pseudoxanthomonas sp.]|nr:histidine kinase [Pseudoxanthomonas sp.]
MPESRPLDALFRPTALIAVILGGEALALILALGPGQPSGGRLVQFGLASLGVQWIALGTLCAIYLARKPLSKLSATMTAWICLGLLLSMTALVSGAASRIPGIVGESPGEDAAFVWRMLALALVVGLLGLLSFQNYWRATSLAVLAKQSELDTLRARVQPHFLFNTLNTGAALVRQHPADAEQLLLDLADIFRAALAGPRFSGLDQELLLARRYLDIESLRFGDRLRTEWDLPDVVPDAVAPTLSIQPLVENAIRHGIEPAPQGGVVTIALAVTGRDVRVTVRNSLAPPGAAARNGHGIGQSAVRARLEALPGAPGRLETDIGADRYTATVVLPLADALSRL